MIKTKDKIAKRPRPEISPLLNNGQPNPNWPGIPDTWVDAYDEKGERIIAGSLYSLPLFKYPKAYR